MALYVDENGENLGEWEEGRLETLTALVNSLEDHWNAGTLSLAAAVAIYAQTAELSEGEAAEFLAGVWIDDVLERMQFDR